MHTRPTTLVESRPAEGDRGRDGAPAPCDPARRDPRLRAARIEATRGALSAGDLTRARHLADLVLSADPQDAEGHFLAGVAEAGAGRVHAGVDHLRLAVARHARGEYLAQLAKLLVLTRRDGEAAAMLREAELDLPEDALSRDTMGCVYARLGDHAAALGHFVAAVDLAPRNTEYRYNHAVTLNFLGRIEEAERALEALIALAPDSARAHHLLANLKKQTEAGNHVPRLARVLDAASSPRDRLLLGYALAKELEDVGQPAAAMERLVAANAEHRASLPYDFGRDAAAFDAIEAAWPLPPADQAPADAPIFIVGMPRTGTTLVDRILSSHPLVESAGELQAMPLAVKMAAGTRSPTVLDPATIAAAAQADMGRIGADYLHRANHHRREPSLRFVDKFPGNFQYAGFIARALPNARIVCLRRHPLDTVLSNFRNLFAVSSRYYDYSYDLIDIARYYVRFDRLMAIWREAMPDRLIEVHYEQLVADQEGETRRIVEHCGLEWSDACLSFHTNDAPVSTPSAAQVRQPIYATAVARWRQHEALLAPARDVLERAGIPVT